MSSSPAQRNIPLTYGDYVHLPSDGKRYEIVGGELYVSPAPSPFHQTVSRRLQFTLMASLEQTGIAVVFNAPIDVVLGNTTVVQPDLAIVRTSRKHLITARAIEGAPDLIVEILSPSTKGQDQHLKRTAYAKHEVPEYWIVDPELGAIEVLRRDEAGVYQLHRRFDRASTLHSPEFSEISVALPLVFAEI